MKKKNFNWHQGVITSIAKTNGDWNVVCQHQVYISVNSVINQQVNSLTQKQEGQGEWQKGLQCQGLWVYSTFTDTLIE